MLQRSLPEQLIHIALLNYAWRYTHRTTTLYAYIKHQLDHNPAFISNMTAERLADEFTTDAIHDEKISVLFCLSRTLEGLALLNRILDEKPELLISITAEMLDARWAIFPETSSSTLFWLTSCDAGISILTRLVSASLLLLEGITIDMLFAERTIHIVGCGMEVVTPFHLLLRSPVGLKFFTVIQYKDPIFINSILARFLKINDSNKFISDNSELFKNIIDSLFLDDWSTDEIEIISLLLDAKPQWAEYICDKLIPVNFNPAENFQFSNLTKYHPLGHAVINKLLDLRPGFKKRITTEILGVKFVAHSFGFDLNGADPVESIYGPSSLYYLGESLQRRQLLATLLENNSILVMDIIRVILDELRPVNDKTPSALYSLLRTPQGCKLFNRLLDENPELAIGITAEMLDFSMNANYVWLDDDLGNETAVTSPHMWLTATNSGVEVFTLLLDSTPGLARTITVTQLTTSVILNEMQGVGEEQGPFLSTTFHCMMCSVDGRRIFKRLTDANPQLATRISATMLEKQWMRDEFFGRLLRLTEPPFFKEPLLEEAFIVKFSALDLLAATQDGCALLQNLLQKNLALAKEFSETGFMLLSNAAILFESVTIILLLKMCKTGRVCLQMIFQANETLRNSMRVRDELQKQPKQRTQIKTHFDLCYGTLPENGVGAWAPVLWREMAFSDSGCNLEKDTVNKERDIVKRLNRTNMALQFRPRS